jgi:hypothetical protein
MRRSIAALCGVLAAMVLAAGPVSAAPAGTSPGILAGAVHGVGTWSYADGSGRTFTADYGRITGLGPARIRIHRPDGVTVVVAWDRATCVRRNGRPALRRSLRLGMRAVTIAESRPGGSLRADAVRAGTPLVRPDDPGCGLLQGAVHGDPLVTYRDGSTRRFGWDRGDVSEVTDSDLSLHRADGATVTVAYDDHTVVTGGETMAGVDAGDRVTVVSEPRASGLPLALLVRLMPG